MNFTITTLSEVHSGITVSLDKLGNKYMITLNNPEIDEFTHKTYDHIEDVLDVFQRFAEAFVIGLYSYEDRKNWLR